MDLIAADVGCSRLNGIVGVVFWSLLARVDSRIAVGQIFFTRRNSNLRLENDCAGALFLFPVAGDLCVPICWKYRLAVEVVLKLEG